MALSSRSPIKEHPLWGSLSAYRRDPLGFGHALAARGDLTRTRFFNKRVLFVVHPDLVHQLLVRDAAKYHKSPAYRFLDRFLGQGLLNTDGEVWRRHRRLVQPAFHHARVQSYAQVMVDYAAETASSWGPGEVLAINREMMRLTLRVVAKALFSADVAGQARRIGEAIEVLLGATTATITTPIPPPAWLPTPLNRRSKRAVRALDEVVGEVIAARRRSGEDTGDLLSMLLLTQDDTGGGMSDKEVRDEAVTLISAGHETTANTLTWAFYLLAQHPDVDGRLQAELRGVLGGRPPSFADLPDLPYTEMVVKETLRLFPAAPEIGRQAVQDTTLGAHPVSKGTILVVPIHALHRDPRWFESPHAFRPERFAKGAAAPPKLAYLPFGAGPRICIGNAFAQMEATLILATLAQRHRLELLPGQRVIPEATLTLRPKEDLWMRVRAR